MELFHKMISGFLGIPERQISSTLHLLGEGATIPFISRYRKEATGGLDEVQIEQIKEQHDKLCDIAKRKETILGTITELQSSRPGSPGFPKCRPCRYIVPSWLLYG